MSNVKKLTLASMLVAVGVVFSGFYIPVGVAKVFPIQHFINVLAAVTLGPAYGVGMAFTTSVIRVSMGTGSMLAFPGSMCGALLAGILYRRRNEIKMAFIGEVFGTGIIGALLAFPIAMLFLSKEMAFYGFVIPFALSSFAGATISTGFIAAIKNTGILNKFVEEK